MKNNTLPMSVQSSRRYYVNSENRISGTSSNFTYTFDIPDGSNFDSCLVVDMSIPFTYYIVRTGNNFFTLRELGVDTVITVPRGNYDARTFATALVALLNTNSPNGWTYSITLDMTLAKYTYTVTGNGANQPSFILVNHLADQTGFATFSTNTFVASLLTSTDVLNFAGPNCLYVHSDMVDDQSSILQSLYPSNTIPFSFITKSCPDPDLYTKKLRTNNSGVFSFSVTDSDNAEIDLNGGEVVFELMLYKKLTIGDMFKKYLELGLAK